MKTILLLRGLGREIAHWGDSIEALEKAGFKVLCIDLPGAGEHRHLISPLHIEDYVSFLRNQLELLRAPSELYLLGHSLGGMIALRWAFENPERFKKVFLLNTSDAHSKKIPERVRAFGIKKLLQISYTRNTRDKEKRILEMISNNTSAQKKVLDSWIQIANLRPISLTSQINQLIAASRFCSPESIDCPLVYISSKADKMVSHKCSENLARLHKAPLELHQKAGHDLFLDDTDWMVEKIKHHCS